MLKENSGLMLAGSVIGGIIFFIAGEWIYHSLGDKIPMIMLVLIYFLLMQLVYGLIVYYISKIIYNKGNVIINHKKVILTILVMAIIVPSFEYIYELDINVGILKSQKAAQSCIFVIDNSGSMSMNDPDDERYRAINNMLENKEDDFEFAMYTFNDNVERQRNMSPKNVQYTYGIINNTGRTSMLQALTYINSDIEEGSLTVYPGTYMVLLSDGKPTDILYTNDLDNILSEYKRRGLIINTVGINDFDDYFLGYISDNTGGIYVKVDNIEKLASVYNDIGAVNRSKRSLIDYRDEEKFDIVHFLMRIVFTFVLGFNITILKLIVCDRLINTKIIEKSSIITDILAAFIIEIGMNVFHLSPVFVRACFCILVAFTMSNEKNTNNVNNERAVKISLND